ncbi:zinc finger Ran-binding domain-containing protein 2-like [Mya arenaria]|uniref:zinc finger Ran-binding domain-containing protein 2-like n=1 Tax=Mya arenaria TaxID=6604 RepID=UPI0022E469E4|nr:zinc finger Ran-binding domain-containing protein 2-like [Mya arenaria]
MSDGGGSVGLLVGAGVGGCALVVGIIALVIYCYMKARKEKAHTNMKKSPDVFSTAASNTQFDLPQRSKVNQNPDPAAARRSRRREREGRERGHVNPGYARNSSDSSSFGSDVDGRDLSPPRVRTAHLSSDSSYDDSSSVDEEIPGNSTTYRMEKETDRRQSYKRSRQNDILDSRGDNPDSGRYRRTNGESQRMSRRDGYERNPRSDSPLTIGSLKKHEERLTGGRGDQRDDRRAGNATKSRKREESPSARTYESSEMTGSVTTRGTDFTATTVGSGSRFQKNPSLRRNSPHRSSSHRRYRKDSEKDEKGRKRPRRTPSAERERQERKSQRSKSPGSERSSRSGSSRSGSSRQTKSEAKKLNQQQAVLPIFADTKKKKSSAV